MTYSNNGDVPQYDPSLVNDPNAGYQQQPAQGGGYGYAPDQNFSGDQYGQGNIDPTTMYNAMFSHNPNAQGLPQGQPQQFQPQYQPPQQFQQQPPAQFQPQYQPPQQFQQPQFPANNFNQGQPQAQPQALPVGQFFQQQEQFPQPGYPQADPYQQQPGYPQPMFNPGYQPPQPGYPQQQGYPQADPYQQGFNTQQQGYGQPPQQFQQNQPDPLAAYDERISSLEDKLGAANLAMNLATQQGADQGTLINLAREAGSLQSQLTALYVERGNTESRYAEQRLSAVRNEYVQQYAQMARGYFGTNPSDGDVRELQQYLETMMTPQLEPALRDPLIQGILLKSFSFDKMVARRGGGQRQAPRDYVPSMQGQGYAGQPFGQPNNFGQGQPQGGPIGFAALSEQQRLGFLINGNVRR